MKISNVKHKVLNIALVIVFCIICYQAIKENEAILFGKSSKRYSPPQINLRLFFGS